MPPDDGLWFYNDENGPPVTPDPGQPGPQEPIRGAQFRPFSRRALEYANLVPKRQNLHLESGVIAKQGRQRSKECRQNIEHWITKEGKKLTSIISGGWSLREGQYLPKEKILVNADLYSPPAQGAPAPAPNPNMRTLQRNIQRMKLDVAQHVPIHGQPGPGDQFAQIMGRQTN